MEKKRLIDATDFLDLFYVASAGQDKAFISTVEMVVDDTPDVDAVEVVRCKDCLYRDQSFRCIALYYGFNPNDDWFCANGKRDGGTENGDVGT